MNVKNNVILFLSIFIMSVYFSIPSLLNLDKEPKINLGLDLQGGLYVLLEADKKDIYKKKLENIISQIKYISEDKEYILMDLKRDIDNNSITFTILEDNKEIEDFFKKLFKKEKLELEHKYKKDEEEGIYKIYISEELGEEILNEKMKKTVEVIRNRLNQFGLSEPSVVRNGSSRVVVEVPGVNTIEEEQRIIKLITTTAYLQFMKVAKDNKNTIILQDFKNKNIKYKLKNITILDGEYLENAQMGFDQNNQIQISFEFTNEGGHIFRKFTSNNIGEQLAIVIDNKVYSAPVIQTAIGKNGSITGNFTPEEAKDLAIALKSGSSGVKLTILEKKTIGASLGEDSIKNGAISLIFGFLLVLVFIVWFYKKSGLVISFALIANLFLILTFMAFMNATMTLPGIIGIVLTIGMAIDSNILINERIKEEIRNGNKYNKAFEIGFEKAFSTILDANITTLLASLVLYAYGNSTIKGFALTLSVGILSSMFTAIYGTKNLYKIFKIEIKA